MASTPARLAGARPGRRPLHYPVCATFRLIDAQLPAMLAVASSPNQTPMTNLKKLQRSSATILTVFELRCATDPCAVNRRTADIVLPGFTRYEFEAPPINAPSPKHKYIQMSSRDFDDARPRR